jgi:hypothetical protein
LPQPVISQLVNCFLDIPLMCFSLRDQADIGHIWKMNGWLQCQCCLLWKSDDSANACVKTSNNLIPSFTTAFDKY